jgi:hypothetical protein
MENRINKVAPSLDFTKLVVNKKLDLSAEFQDETINATRTNNDDYTGRGLE